MKERARLLQVFGPWVTALLMAAACCAIALALDPPWLARYRTYCIATVAVAVGALVVRLAGYVLFDIVFRRRKGREAPDILRFVVSVIGYSALVVLLFSFVFHRDLSGVLATSAVVSVIIGLALQDTLGNFFAGLSLHIEQPYHIGDAIRMGDILGRVESVTWRTTSFRTNNNSVIVVPNSRIAREPIEIYALDSETRRILRLPAPYSANPERVMAIVRGAVHGIPGMAARAPVVRVGDFAESSVTYELLYWVSDHMVAAELDTIVRERIWYAFRRAGLDIPFPMRHLEIQRSRPAPAAAADPAFVRAIASIPVFAPLNAEEIREVAGSAVKSVYAPGEEVLHRGEAGESMFVILRGSAEIHLAGGTGVESQPMAVLQAGEFFGEMALLTGESRTADVRARSELELLEIRKSALEPLMQANQQLAAGFSRVVAERQEQLARHARVASERQQPAGTETILARIRRFFSLR